MLRNELKNIEEILLEQSSSDSDKAASIDINHRLKQIHKAWEEAVFSDSSESSLVRYFHYHLDNIINISAGLCDLADSIGFIPQQNELLALIDHLRKYFSNYFNERALAPAIYHQRLVSQHCDIICSLVKNIKHGRLDPALKACVLKWLIDMTENLGIRQYTFRSLSYFENILNQISLIDYNSGDSEDLLVSILTRSNYNSLSFFVFRQKIIRDSSGNFKTAEEKLHFLYRQKAGISSDPEAKNIAYDPAWPSLKTMLGDWLQEEILLTEKSLSNLREVTISKIPLEISVAHLSCLIRLLYEESVFATQNLQSIFKCFAGYFQSKRQAVISPASLSKEFYSIDQHTAARVRDLLQRMVQRINRNFFPMVVAINATVLSYLSTR